MNYAEKLRAFADYLDEHPVVAERMEGRYCNPSIYTFAEDWEQFQGIIRDLDGFTKSGYNGSLSARHEEQTEDGEMIFTVLVSVSGACEAKPKLDEDGQPVMRRVMKQVPTDELEQEMEWKCPDVWTRG